MTEVPRDMIRVRRSVEICLVATITISWQSLVLVVHMAIRTRHGLVCADEWKWCAAVKECGWPPHGCVMTWGAVVIEVTQNVIWICWLRELRCMTRIAVCVCQLIIPTNMALLAQCRDVNTGKRKSRCCMVERCRSPRALCVALCAIMIEVARGMTGIRRIVKRRLMATEAIRRETLILVVYVTLDA
jgi:hypothetical protein